MSTPMLSVITIPPTDDHAPKRMTRIQNETSSSRAKRTRHFIKASFIDNEEHEKHIDEVMSREMFVL